VTASVIKVSKTNLFICKRWKAVIVHMQFLEKIWSLRILCWILAVSTPADPLRKKTWGSGTWFWSM